MPTTYAIKNGRTVFTPTAYTANGGAQTISNAASGTSGFKPDLVWTKSRSTVATNLIANSIAGPSYYLRSDNTAAQALDTSYYQSFNSNGFSVGSGNFANGVSMIGWQWQAGQGTTSTNTNGSITSTVSANPTAGFSIVTFTTPASGSATYGHGLNAAPQLIIVKPTAVISDWPVYSASIGASNRLLLNGTNASTADSAWNSTAPTSTVFSTGGSLSGSLACVAFCWTGIPGFSQFGTYVGNGSTDGPFVYTGFRPAWIMTKRVDNVALWAVQDTGRNPYNSTNLTLFPDSDAAEVTNGAGTYSILSNGFKMTSVVVNEENVSGATYIYAAFAECPFKYANAR